MGQLVSRLELHELVWTEPVKKIAPRFGVSDVALAKACRRARIPLPPRGYWPKLRAGKRVTRQPLPPAPPGVPETVRFRPRRGTAPLERTTPLAARAPAPPVPVPERLTRPHPLVSATREAARRTKPGQDKRLHVGPAAGVFRLTVSRDQLSRAFRILQAICAEAERRGWTLMPVEERWRRAESGIAITAGRQGYLVALEEQTNPLPFTDGEVLAWRAHRSRWDTRTEPPAQMRRRQPTGLLSLVLPADWSQGRARWSDGKRQRLEDTLGDFFAAIALRADRDEERAQRREREEAERQERARQVHIERVRATRLEEEVRAWSEAESIRGYVSALRATLTKVPAEDSERLAAWCDWSEAHAAALDPTLNENRIVGLNDDERSLSW